MRARILVVGMLCALTGCVSNLKVRKVPVHARIAGEDHIDGFRYYLSRPYVVVKEPIEVATQQAIVAATRPIPEDQASLRFLNGPRAGETVLLSELTVTSPGSPDVRRLTPAEVDGLLQVIQDPAVRPAQYVAGSGGRVRAVETGGSPGFVGDEVDTSSLEIPTLAEPPAIADRDSVSGLVGKIDVVFLPDLDEQYAIKSKNFLSKNAFNLKFQNGWELTDVAAEHDSTTVALEFLNTVDKAVNAAKSIASAGLAAAPGAGAKSIEDLNLREGELYYLRVTTYIKPGLYRINKPWEMGSVPRFVGCGLLAKLGLTTVTEVAIEPITKPTGG